MSRFEQEVAFGWEKGFYLTKNIKIFLGFSSVFRTVLLNLQDQDLENLFEVQKSTSDLNSKIFY